MNKRKFNEAQLKIILMFCLYQKLLEEINPLYIYYILLAGKNSSEINNNEETESKISNDNELEERRLTYMMGRFMDNATGRFISADTHKDGLNYYVYCGNNPTTRIDPDGHDFGISVLVCAIVGAVIGTIVGGVIGGTVAYRNYELSMKLTEGAIPTYNLVGAMFAGIFLGILIGSSIGFGLGSAGGAAGSGVAAWVGGAAASSVGMATSGFISFMSMSLPSIALAGSLAASLLGVGDNAGVQVLLMGLSAAGCFANKDLQNASNAFYNAIDGGNRPVSVTIGATFSLMKETFMENYSPDFSRANAQLSLMAQPTNGGYFTFKSEKDIIAENLRNHRGLYYSDNRGAAEREVISLQNGDDLYAVAGTGTGGVRNGDKVVDLIMDAVANGQNAIYLNESTAVNLGYKFGHSGWIIQDDSGNWIYISKDGLNWDKNNLESFAHPIAEIIDPKTGYQITQKNDIKDFFTNGLGSKYDRIVGFNLNNADRMLMIGIGRMNYDTGYWISGYVPLTGSNNCADLAYMVGRYTTPITRPQTATPTLIFPHVARATVPNWQYNQLK